MRPTATVLHPHSRRRQFRRGRVPREPPPCRGTRPAGSRLLRPFPSTSLFRPPLRPFFSYSGGRRGVADEKRRSRRPGAAALAGILVGGHPDRGLDAVDDGLSAVGASAAPAVAARGHRRGGKGGQRVTFGCPPTPALTGNGVIAPLRDGMGAEPGVKDMRRPPFRVSGPAAGAGARADDLVIPAPDP